MVNLSAYIEYYQQWVEVHQKMWANTKRPEYEADFWYSLNRNKIALEMISHKWEDKKVLALGAAFWVDAALLDSVNALRVIRTDIVKSEGIKVLADACNLPFKDKSIGAILCREVIEHVYMDADLMWEVSRVLEDGGYLYIMTPNGFNTPPDGKSHIRAYTPLLLLQTLERYGFTIVDKRGNVPNIHRSLIPGCVQGQTGFIEEFKILAEKYDALNDSYYFGSELFVLARKGE